MQSFDALPAIKRAILMARRKQYPWVEEGPVGDMLLDALAEGLPRWIKEKRGYVYVAANASWPDLYKIGCTRKSVETRMLSLGGAGMATPWVSLIAWHVYDAHGLEALAHEACADFCVKGELFHADCHELIARIQLVLDTDCDTLRTYLARVLSPDVLETEIRIELQAPPVPH